MTPFARLILLTVVVTLTPSVQAEVYKYYDSNGNLVLTDAPPKDTPKPAERVDVRPIMTVPAFSPTTGVPASTPAPAATVPVGSYKIVIQSPTNDATFQRNAGEEVPVAYSVDPAPAGNHKLSVLLDGSALENASAIPTAQLDRGTHTLMVQVADEKNNVLASASASFHIQQRTNLLGPTAPKPKPPKK